MLVSCVGLTRPLRYLQNSDLGQNSRFCRWKKPFANRHPGRCSGLYILWSYRPLWWICKRFFPSPKSSNFVSNGILQAPLYCFVFWPGLSPATQGLVAPLGLLHPGLYIFRPYGPLPGLRPGFLPAPIVPSLLVSVSSHKCRTGCVIMNLLQWRTHRTVECNRARGDCTTRCAR